MSQVITDKVTDKTKKFEKEFSFVQYETPQPNDEKGNEVKAQVTPADVTELAEQLQTLPFEDAAKLVKATNYGLNLRARATARQQAEAMAEGPDKAIEKAIKALEGCGYKHDEAVAIARAKHAAEAEAQAETGEADAE